MTKTVFLIVCTLATQLIFSQEELQLTKKDSIVERAWIIGLGFNFVDDSGDEFGNLLDIGDGWNAVPFPSRFNIGHYFKNGLGLEFIGSYNRYKTGKIIDRIENQEDIDYYAADFRVSYDLNHVLGETGFFDPYVGIGVGYTDANNQGRGTYNAIIGFRTWFSDRFGLDFNSTGKWTMNINNSTNHIQHAVGAVYRFGIEKGLSKKGEEKLALIQEMEKEQQRIQDSIAEAKRVEEEARRLAEELERKREAEQLAAAAAEREKQNSEETKRKALQDKIDALDNVYFDYNSSYLNKESKNVLDKIYEILKENPQVTIKIKAYTDSRGSEEYNYWLSKRRANNTVNYLKNKGLSDIRVSSEGLGESELVEDCGKSKPCSEAIHSKNRRSEFFIISR